MFSAKAQLWNIDFDSSTGDLFMDTYNVTFHPPDAPATVNYSTIETGDPTHHKVLRFTSDSSASAYGWYTDWTAMLVVKPVSSYDPEHTFVEFDLLVYELRPLHIQVSYAISDPFTLRGLQLDITPAVTGSFQRFTLPLTAFQVAHLIGTPPNYPASMQFGIRGDPANPDTTWPSCATNMFLLDNIKYIVSPALSIQSSNNAVILSWPTNAIGFTLQQNSAFATEGWTAVTNAPIIVNGQSQVLLSEISGRSFFRLVSQ
jgi:hypothetical protein